MRRKVQVPLDIGVLFGEKYCEENRSGCLQAEAPETVQQGRVGLSTSKHSSSRARTREKLSLRREVSVVE